MPYDGLALRAAAREMDETLRDGRIEKVLQPEKDEIHIIIRSRGENHRLVCSCSAAHPRAHISSVAKMGPLQAPPFCMLLRKHLIGGRVASVRQYDMERVLELAVQVRDELGVSRQLTLRVEIMGRHSNIILTDEQSRVIDCIKHVTDDMSRVRAMLPGLSYTYPPGQDKQDPLALSAQDFARLLSGDGDTPLVKVLTARLAGLSAATARELVADPMVDADAPLSRLSDEDRSRLAALLEARFSALARFEGQPCLIRDPESGQVVDFLPFMSRVYPPAWQLPQPSLQRAMDEYYTQRDRAERISQRTAHLVALVKRNLERCRAKRAHQQETLESAERMEEYRLYGDLLTGHLHMIRRGMTDVTLPNWNDPEGTPVTIPLDPTRDGSRNAQQYYKKYQKARKALELVQKQITQTDLEIEYLEGQLQYLSACETEAEAAEIEAELAREGYLRAPAAKGSRRLPPSRPLHYRSRDGFDIYVGRNNQQNDQLTLRFARGDDVWMHTQQIPGSHVIIQAKNGQVSPQALEAGALLAAWHSQARHSSNVPVDYTPRRYIKKPGGAKPGYVIYTTYRTLTVTPRAEAVRAIEQVTQEG